MELSIYVHLLIYFVVFGMLSRGMQVDEDSGTELLERIARIEARQTSQQLTIENQQAEIAFLKSSCGKGEKWSTGKNTGVRVNGAVTQNQTSSLDKQDRDFRRQATGNNFVSFSAYLDHDENLPMFGKLALNKEIINEGGAYDSTTGIFTCPLAGVYLFSFFLGQRDQHQASLHLVVNNERTVAAIVESFHDTQDAQGGNVVIKRLDKGDQVWLKLIVGSHIEGASNMRVTSFSGVLLHE